MDLRKFTKAGKPRKVATSPRSGHTLTIEDQRRGGRNGKRGPSIKAQWEKILAGDVPQKLLDALENHFIIRGDGIKIPTPIKPFSKKAIESFALIGLHRAMTDSDKLYTVIQQAIDGMPKQEIDVADKTDIAKNDEAVKAFITKHGLFNRA